MPPRFEFEDAINKTFFDVIPLGIYFYKPPIFSVFKRMDPYDPLEYMLPTSHVQGIWMERVPFCPAWASPDGIEVAFWLWDQYIRLVPKSEPLPEEKIMTYQVLNIIGEVLVHSHQSQNLTIIMDIVTCNSFFVSGLGTRTQAILLCTAR
jgi:hypothetical protein